MTAKTGERWGTTSCNSSCSKGHRINLNTAKHRHSLAKTQPTRHIAFCTLHTTQLYKLLVKFSQCEPLTTHSGYKSQETVGSQKRNGKSKCSHLQRPFVTSWVQWVAPLCMETIDEDAKSLGSRNDEKGWRKVLRVRFDRWRDKEMEGPGLMKGKAKKGIKGWDDEGRRTL